MPTKRATYLDVVAAAKRLHGVAHKTPVLTSSRLNESMGAQVFFKCENYQRVGAFKFRGAYNALSQLSAENKRGGVISCSSGNHAQSVALAGRLLGVPVTVVMPKDAPELKVRATKEYGATVVHYDRYTEIREEIAYKMQAENPSMAIIPSSDHKDVICGQATAAKELFEEVGELDYLFACVGGGGLLSGSCLSAQGLSPNCKVYGVEPESCNDGQQSFAKGEVIHIKPQETIADGAQNLFLGTKPFEIIKDHAAGFKTVTDQQLIDSMKFFGQTMKMIVEPTGCLAAAQVMFGDIDLTGKRVGVMISGGNVDLNKYAKLIV